MQKNNLKLLFFDTFVIYAETVRPMKNRFFRLFLLAIFPVLMLSMNSCHILNPNIMLEADKNYVFDTLSKDTTVAKEYRLNPNDIVEFRLFANEGFRMIDILSSASSNTTTTVARQGFEYTLDKEGIVRLPVIGSVDLRGMTVREAELHLEQRFGEFYVKPFVILRVVNKRVIVYTGEPGQAKVISLQNNNTTVIEALALAGGISSNGKAYNIKLIRKTNDPKKPVKVYKLDLSKIQNIDQGNTIVQTNDIIYVEPRRQLASRTLREVTPILSLFSSLTSIYLIATRL
jgi:polysaccharide biosynthesis/export protein